jgi:hypothetical protein
MAYIMTSDAHLYGNHIALALVYSFLLVWMPSGRFASVDAWWRAKRSDDIAIPFASIWTLRAQTFLVYFFGGVAKIHPDWLAGEPMQTWFRGGSTAQMVRDTFGPGLADSLLLPILARHETALFFSYGGLIFDLMIGILLLARRTRPLALALATYFHTFNFLFVNNVGLVAVMAFWATLVFCEPDWPVQLVAWLRDPKLRPPNVSWFAVGMIFVPIIGALLGWKSIPSGWYGGIKPIRLATSSAIVLWITFATLVPLRHFIIEGDAIFSAEGTAFSWFLMTCNKEGEFLRFEIADPQPVQLDDQTWTLVDVTSKESLPPPGDLAILVEPLFGHRLMLRTSARGKTGPFIERYRRNFGRTPNLQPTLPVDEVLSRITDLIGSDSTETSGTRSIRSRIENVRSLLHEMKQASADPPRQRSLYHLLHYQTIQLANELKGRPEGLSILLLMRPFELQPIPLDDDSRWHLVVDPAITSTIGRRVFFEIDRTKWSGPNRFYCVLEYLPHLYWSLWDDVVPIERNGRIERYLWNDSRELNDHQVKALGFFPYLLRQYAEHIAQEWEKSQGRQPEVYVTSFLWLNHHDFQPLVDSHIDLSKQQYRYLQHNDWILKYRPKPAPK